MCDQWLMVQTVIPSADAIAALQVDGCLDVTFVILGASGDLAKKKIYPVLWFAVCCVLIAQEPFSQWVDWANDKLHWLCTQPSLERRSH